MTTYTWPATRVMLPQSCELRVIDNLQRAHESPLSGYTQTQAMPGARWGWHMIWPDQAMADRDVVEAFLLKLSGRQHRVSIWDFRRPRPLGDIALSGVTLGASAAQFATSLQLAGCGANATVLAGDWIGLANGQLVRAVASATASGAGVMTVEVRHMLRSAVASGSAVTLDKPTALYMRTQAGISLPRQPGGMAPGFADEFVEVFA